MNNQPMTWILPKQLHTLAFALDTAALISDSEEQSRIYAQSLFLRSKVSPARTWSAKWKRDSWTAHLSGRILKPSLGERFETEWTSSLVATHASHSQPPGNDSAQTILATSGHSSQMEFGFFDLASASSKTSRDTSASDSERSLANWNQWVTRCRGEYSQRVKSAPLTNGSESSSWPTVTANEDSYRIGGESQQSKCLSAMARRGELGHLAPVNHNTDLSRLESWATPNTMDHLDCRSAEGVIKIATGARKGRSMPSNLREQVDPQTVDIYQKVKEESWATPSTMDYINVVRKPEDRSPAANKGGCKNLREEVHQWPTPAVKDVTGGPYKTELVNGQFRSYHNHTEANPVAYGTNLKDAVRVIEEEKPTGKLNPRWVETLMGLPVGWTMPSCQSPVTIAPTNCDSSETVLCQKPQP